MNYLALLRGINVGGNNIIRKDELKACFEEAGFENVHTYIQSGNILFQSDNESLADITKAIETALDKRMKNKIPVLVLSEKSYRSALESAPKNWGQKDKLYNALFIVNGKQADELIATLPTMTKSDEEVNTGPGVIFWETSKEDRAKSFYARELAKHPLYKQVTIRNSNTSFKLLELFQKYYS